MLMNAIRVFNALFSLKGVSFDEFRYLYDLSYQFIFLIKCESCEATVFYRDMKVNHCMIFSNKPYFQNQSLIPFCFVIVLSRCNFYAPKILEAIFVMLQSFTKIFLDSVQYYLNIKIARMNLYGSLLRKSSDEMLTDLITWMKS